MRELKSQGSSISKERIGVEVKKLLDLKQKLGIAPAAKGNKATKKAQVAN